MKRITIKELAERLGLSPSTVSRALAGDRNIRRETRERVSRLAGELGYRPNPVAVNLRSGRSNTVGVIVPEMVTPFAATVIGGIQRVLYGRGLKVIIAQSDENPQTECGNLELMERFMVDGVIACPCDATRNGEIYRRIRQRGVPLVFYDRAPLRVDASRVIVDDFATSYFLMEHLVRRGCRRIVHLGGPAHIPNARERLRGFRYALGKFGFVSDGRSVIPAGVTFDDGRAAADELLRRMPDADGLFAWTDTVAIGADGGGGVFGNRTLDDRQSAAHDRRAAARRDGLPRCRTGSGKDRRSVGARPHRHADRLYPRTGVDGALKEGLPRTGARIDRYAPPFVSGAADQ